MVAVRRGGQWRVSIGQHRHWLDAAGWAGMGSGGGAPDKRGGGGMMLENKNFRIGYALGSCKTGHCCPERAGRMMAWRSGVREGARGWMNWGVVNSVGRCQLLLFVIYLL